MLAELLQFVDTHTTIIVELVLASVFVVSGGTFLITRKMTRHDKEITFTVIFITLVMFVMFVEIFFATSTFDFIVKITIAGLVLISSFFLLKSLQQEVELKEKITRLLANLDKTHERLHILDAKKSEFINIASHHLRNPLTAITGYVSLLIDGSYGELSPGIKGALSKISDSSTRLITIISDFMDVSQIERGDMAYDFAPVDIKALIVNLVNDMKQTANRALLSLDFMMEEKDKDYLVIADAGKLRQVISNLIDNAIKYTPKGGVTILLRKSDDKKKVIFSISDTGIGMSPETQEKIFRKFSRAEGVSRLYTEGTGLGLYVAKKIMKMHKGDIRGTSKGLGMGSTFTLEL